MLAVLMVPFQGNMVHDVAYGLAFTNGIFVPDPYFVVGETSKAGLASHTFKLYNLRTRKLYVHAEPSCSCIKTSWKQCIILPLSYTSFTMAVPRNGLFKSAPKYVAFRTSDKQVPLVLAYMTK